MPPIPRQEEGKPTPPLQLQHKVTPTNRLPLQEGARPTLPPQLLDFRPTPRLPLRSGRARALPPFWRPTRCTSPPSIHTHAHPTHHAAHTRAHTPLVQIHTLGPPCGTTLHNEQLVCTSNISRCSQPTHRYRTYPRNRTSPLSPSIYYCLITLTFA